MKKIFVTILSMLFIVQQQHPMAPAASSVASSALAEVGSQHLAHYGGTTDLTTAPTLDDRVDTIIRAHEEERAARELGDIEREVHQQALIPQESQEETSYSDDYRDSSDDYRFEGDGVPLREIPSRIKDQISRWYQHWRPDPSNFVQLQHKDNDQEKENDSNVENVPLKKDFSDSNHEKLSVIPIQAKQLPKTKSIPKLQLYPLHNAIKTHKPIQYIENLILAGHNVNQQDLQGNTPLHIATNALYPKAIKSLLQHNASLHITNSRRQKVLDILKTKPTSLQPVLEQAFVYGMHQRIGHTHHKKHYDQLRFHKKAQTLMKKMHNALSNPSHHLYNQAEAYKIKHEIEKIEERIKQKYHEVIALF